MNWLIADCEKVNYFPTPAKQTVLHIDVHLFGSEATRFGTKVLVWFIVDRTDLNSLSSNVVPIEHLQLSRCIQEIAIWPMKQAEM